MYSRHHNIDDTNCAYLQVHVYSYLSVVYIITHLGDCLLWPCCHGFGRVAVLGVYEALVPVNSDAP